MLISNPKEIEMLITNPTKHSDDPEKEATSLYIIDKSSVSVWNVLQLGQRSIITALIFNICLISFWVYFGLLNQFEVFYRESVIQYKR